MGVAKELGHRSATLEEGPAGLEAGGKRRDVGVKRIANGAERKEQRQLAGGW